MTVERAVMTRLEDAGVVEQSRPVTTWPRLAEVALHGLAGDIVRTIAPQSEADPAGLLVSTLAAFGTYVGPGPHALADGAHHPPRLFVALVGKTSRARKGTAQAQVARILEAADPSFASERVFGGLASGEGLISALSEIGADSGDRRALTFEPELARVLKAGAREGSTLSQILRQSWDTGHLRVMTRHNPLRVDGAHVGLVGHITAEELRRNLTDTEIAAGFANRFLFVCVKRARKLPEGGGLEGEAVHAMGSRLRSAADKARAVGRLRRSAEAVRQWAEIYQAIDDDADGLLGAVIARAEAQMLRLSVAYALLDGSGIIEAEHVAAAKAVWDYCEQSAGYVFGEARGDPVADKILDRLRIVHPEGLTRVQVHDLFGNHTPAARIDSAIEALEGVGLVTEESMRTGGRPRIVLRLVVPTGEESEFGEETYPRSPPPDVSSLPSLSSQGDTAQAIALLTGELGAEVVCELPPGAPPTAGVCDFCAQASTHLEPLGFCGRLCEDCLADLRPEYEAWAQWNALMSEEPAS